MSKTMSTFHEYNKRTSDAVSRRYASRFYVGTVEDINPLKINILDSELPVLQPHFILSPFVKTKRVKFRVRKIEGELGNESLADRIATVLMSENVNMQSSMADFISMLTGSTLDVSKSGTSLDASKSGLNLDVSKSGDTFSFSRSGVTGSWQANDVSAPGTPPHSHTENIVKYSESVSVPDYSESENISEYNENLDIDDIFKTVNIPDKTKDYDINKLEYNHEINAKAKFEINVEEKPFRREDNETHRDHLEKRFDNEVGYDNDIFWHDQDDLKEMHLYDQKTVIEGVLWRGLKKGDHVRMLSFSDNEYERIFYVLEIINRENL